jgi:CYTH domain-containing protein
MDTGIMPSEHKYARVEWERRFLLARLPHKAEMTQTRRIVDRYIEGTKLRLRQMSDGDSENFKLTQKLPAETPGVRQGLITTIYLSKEEFEVLLNLPAKILTKTRYSIAPFGIDVFGNALNGLVLAEAEFNSADEAAALAVPPFVVDEVTADSRFTGGSLVLATREDLRRWVAEFGIELA